MKYTAKSNNNGLYTISALPIGTYKVRAEAQSFQAYETNPIRLESGQIARLDIPLQLGVSESVEVMGVSPILQTQDAVVGEVISEGTIQNLPLNGRNFSQLSLLLPGVVTWNPDSFTDPKSIGSGADGERPARAGEQLHARRRRHERGRSTTGALSAQHRRPGRSPGRHQQLLGRVRQRGRRGDRQHHQVGDERVPRDGLRVLARQQPGRQLLGQQPRRRRRRSSCPRTSSAARSAARSSRTSCSSSATTRGSSGTGRASAVTSVAPEAWRRGDFSGVGRHHRRSRHRPAVPREPDPAEPVQPDRAGDPLRPEPLSASQPGRGPRTTTFTRSSDKLRTHQGDFKLDYNASDKDRLFARVSYQHYTSEPDRAPLPSQLAGTNDRALLRSWP